ncbi:MAG: serine/threonine protein phosphatase [Planctomycetes bacterium]|nr:serine/threonine protein phosphatase [Planctomycetota bacterium]
MRTLAIGDIHGCLRAFDLLLDLIQPQPDDLVVTLGDYVDRGPDCKGVIDRLIELQGRCKHVALKGNHDFMMLEARGSPAAFQEWFLVGGKQTLESYGADPRWDLFADAVPAAHWRFLEEVCVPYHEIDTHFFVHANAYPDVPLAEQPEYMLFWEKLDAGDARAHQSGKIMICGHTPQRSGVPLVLEHAICIDTRVYGDEGWLTCLDVGAGAYRSANQRGETRARLLRVD